MKVQLYRIPILHACGILTFASYELGQFQGKNNRLGQAQLDHFSASC